MPSTKLNLIHSSHSLRSLSTPFSLLTLSCLSFVLPHKSDSLFFLSFLSDSSISTIHPVYSTFQKSKFTFLPRFSNSACCPSRIFEPLTFWQPWYCFLMTWCIRFPGSWPSNLASISISISNHHLAARTRVIFRFDRNHVRVTRRHVMNIDFSILKHPMLCRTWWLVQGKTCPPSFWKQNRPRFARSRLEVDAHVYLSSRPTHLT